jgi:hypothetical protein
MNLLEVYIKRLYSDDQGTIGILRVPAFIWKCYINELPDRNNEKCYSRILPGTYPVRCIYTEHYGDVYLIEKVPDRTSILMHCGTYAGDTRKNWKSDVLGCLEFGRKVVLLNDQRAVINSRSTRDEFQKLMNRQNFKLIIS